VRAAGKPMSVARVGRHTEVSSGRSVRRVGHIDRRIHGAVSLRRFTGTKSKIQGGSPADSGGLSEGRLGAGLNEEKFTKALKS
jgi:hypothetical protein